MEYTNEELVAERKPHNGEDKSYVLEEKKLWIPFGKISWPAIFAGVLVITVSQMLLSLLGMGIGISTIEPLEEQNPMKGLSTASIAWWSVTMLVSLFLGGLTTGKMYQTRSKAYLTWHGLLTWCTFTVFSFFMLATSVGMLISGAGNVIRTAVTAGASVNQNRPLDISSITRNVQNLLLTPNAANPEGTAGNDKVNYQYDNQGNRLTQNDVTNNAVRAMGNPQGTSGSSRSQTSANRNVTANNNLNTNAGTPATAERITGGRVANNPYLVNEVEYFFTDKNVQSPDARENLIKALRNQTGMTAAEAGAQVDQWTATYDQLKADAKVKADEAAKAVSIASIIGFCALVLGALVTIWGARVAPAREYAVGDKIHNQTTKIPVR